MRTSTVSRATVLAVCCVAIACSDSGPPPADNVAVANLFAELNGASAIGASGASVSGINMMGVGGAPAMSGCPFDTSTQRFVCAPVVSAGLTFHRSYQLLDASNAPLSSFDVTKVVAIRVVTDMDGVTSQSGVTTQIVGHDDATLSGLKTDTHTLNSSGTTELTVTGTSVPPLHATVSQTVTNLVLPKHGSGNNFPQSGTIATTITSSSGTGPAIGTATITMTFNGTSTATMTFASGGVTRTCTMNLANPQNSPSCL